MTETHGSPELSEPVIDRRFIGRKLLHLPARHDRFVKRKCAPRFHRRAFRGGIDLCAFFIQGFPDRRILFPDDLLFIFSDGIGKHIIDQRMHAVFSLVPDQIGRGLYRRSQQVLIHPVSRLVPRPPDQGRAAGRPQFLAFLNRPDIQHTKPEKALHLLVFSDKYHLKRRLMRRCQAAGKFRVIRDHDRRLMLRKEEIVRLFNTRNREKDMVCCLCLAAPFPVFFVFQIKIKI